MLGKHRRTIKKYENGERRITPRVATEISAIFGIDLSAVLIGRNKKIELTPEEYAKYFQHLIHNEPDYERKRKKPIDYKQAALLKRKWVNPINFFQ